MALTPKQRRFVEEYLVDLNATQAAKRAGYNPKTAHTIGHENLSKPEIAAELAIRRRAVQDRTEITQDRTLLEIARLAFSDPRRAFRSDGALLPVKEWPDDVAASIASIKVKRVLEDGAPTEVAEVKFWDKNSALEKAAKFQGLYEKDNKQKGPVTVVFEARDAEL